MMQQTVNFPESVTYVSGKPPYYDELIPGLTCPESIQDMAARIFGEGVDFTYRCDSFGVFDKGVSKLYTKNN